MRRKLRRAGGGEEDLDYGGLLSAASLNFDIDIH
jgi:hypothetical protein